MAYGREQKEQNTLIAMGYLIGKGWTPMQAAAIVGNLTVESYLNPDTPRGDHGSAMGLAQWRDERLAKYKELYGKDVEGSTLKEQLDFVDWELRNTHKKAGQALLAAGNIEEGTAAIDKYYERSAGLHGEKRLKHAKAALDNWHMVSGKVQKAGALGTETEKSKSLTDMLEWLVGLFKQEN